MNKKQAIEELKKHRVGLGDNTSIRHSKVLEIINQIHEPQKVVVPKFVAEWIETHKRWMPFLSSLFTDNLGEELKEWLDFSDNQNLMAKAWLDGYEVEKGPLYTVEIPDPHGPYEIRYLLRNSAGNICIGVANHKDIFLDAKTHLTESEIKQNFEWAWQFAKEVDND